MNGRLTTLIEWPIRIGTGIMYLYSGFDLFLHPNAWKWAIPPWLDEIISSVVAINTYIKFQGLVEIVIALMLFAWFLKPVIVKYVALISALEMAAIILLAFLPFKESVFFIVFRDIGVLGGSLALYFVLKYKEQAQTQTSQASPAISTESYYPQYSYAPRYIWFIIGSILLAGGVIAYLTLSQSQTRSLEEPQLKPSSQSKTTKAFTVVAAKNTWSFNPDVIEVNRGDKVVLNLVNEDSYDHGFAIDALGVNQRMPANSQTKVEFIATQAGEFPFYCSVICGEGIVNGVKRGHFDQVGKLRVR